MTDIQTIKKAHKSTRSTNEIFGLKSTYDTAELILIPAEWEVSTSYKQGTASSPEKIKKASIQCDLYHHEFTHMPEHSIFYCEPDPSISALNKKVQPKAKQIIEKLNAGEDISENKTLQNDIVAINQASENCLKTIYKHTETAINQDKIIGLIGGDHSCSLGVISALIDYIDSFAILQIDAHMDLRHQYQGLTHSHASVMYNALQINDISRLIQVGVRDYCEEEFNRVQESKGRIKTYYNHDIKKELFNGKTWESVCKKIINNCPDNLYITCDIDGLSPSYCPHTGTAVPGGLDYDQIIHLLHHIVKSGKRIIGFDLVEVAGQEDSIDIITGAHLLYQLCTYAWASHQ